MCCSNVNEARLFNASNHFNRKSQSLFCISNKLLGILSNAQGIGSYRPNISRIKSTYSFTKAPNSNKSSLVCIVTKEFIFSQAGRKAN
jgi:hypothetical protein